MPLELNDLCPGQSNTEQDSSAFAGTFEEIECVPPGGGGDLPNVNKADKLVYFATVDSHVSYRDKDKGTWMIQEFVK